VDTRTEDRPGLDLVWEAAGIAKEINRTPRQVYHLLSTGAISAARRIGGRWCADRNALRRQFEAIERGESSRTNTND
jgi:hypothetical protein